MAKFGMELGWEALSAPTTVEWKSGDEFEGARKASQGAVSFILFVIPGGNPFGLSTVVARTI